MYYYIHNKYRGNKKNENAIFWYTGWSWSTFRKLGIWLLGLFYEEKFIWTYVLNDLVSEIQGVQISKKKFFNFCFYCDNALR